MNLISLTETRYIRHRMEGYRIPAVPIFARDSAQLKVFAGSSIENGEVIVKSFSCPVFAKANRYLNEAVALASIEHPNNVRLVEVKLSELGKGCTVHLVLERMERSLKQEIDSRATTSLHFKEAEVLGMIRESAQGLAYAKQKSVAHRDVKPANIFLNASGNYKVADYSPNHWSTAPTYYSPQLRETLMGRQEEYDLYANDVYSLGLTALHMARLSPASRLQTFTDLQRKTAAEVSALPYSPALKSLLLGMLRPSESERLTMEEVLKEAVEACTSHSEEDEAVSTPLSEA